MVQSLDMLRKAAARKKFVQRFRKTQGSVIATAIRDSDKTQRDVAEVVEMTEDSISEVVQGHRKTELGEIVSIAKAIDEDPEVLIRRMLNWHS